MIPPTGNTKAAIAAASAPRARRPLAFLGLAPVLLTLLVLTGTLVATGSVRAQTPPPTTPTAAPTTNPPAATNTPKKDDKTVTPTGDPNFVAQYLIAPVLGLVVQFVGWLLLKLVAVLISVASYNSFVDAPAVAKGWIIVRDLTNMFFILVLLVLAFGTMLGVEAYSYKNRMLPRLLIMAVVINFSRTICGLLIDFGQVVMLTFVNGFASAAGGNFIEAFKLKELLAWSGTAKDGVGVLDILMAYLLALAMVTISLGVIIIMLTVLIFRIIYLWLLVVLSPLAFFMKAVPGGKASGYYSEWWSMFTSNIVTGPILAFFLWLSLVTIASGGADKDFKTLDDSEAKKVGTNSGEASKAMGQATLESFIISIALLLGGVQMAQKAGGAGASVGASLAKGVGKGVGRQLYKSSGLQNRVEAVKGVMAEREYQRKGQVKTKTQEYMKLAGGVENFAGKVGRTALSPGESMKRYALGQSTQLTKQAEGLKEKAAQARERAKELQAPGKVVNPTEVIKEQEKEARFEKEAAKKMAEAKKWETGKMSTVGGALEKVETLGGKQMAGEIEKKKGEAIELRQKAKEAEGEGDFDKAEDLKKQAKSKERAGTALKAVELLRKAGVVGAAAAGGALPGLGGVVGGRAVAKQVESSGAALKASAKDLGYTQANRQISSMEKEAEKKGDTKESKTNLESAVRAAIDSPSDTAQLQAAILVAIREGFKGAGADSPEGKRQLMDKLKESGADEKTMTAGYEFAGMTPPPVLAGGAAAGAGAAGGKPPAPAGAPAKPPDFGGFTDAVGKLESAVAAALKDNKSPTINFDVDDVVAEIKSSGRAQRSALEKMRDDLGKVPPTSQTVDSKKIADAIQVRISELDSEPDQNA